MLNFLSDDWKFIKDRCEKRLLDFRNILENPEKTYKEKLVANGRILAYREVLNMPQSASAEAALNQNR